MLIIGSEQSVFTMVLITIQRLRAIMNPMIRPKSRYVVTMIGMTWIISLIIGLVPMIPRLEDYFVTSIAFTDNKIFKSIHQDDKQNLTNWLNLLSTNKTSSDEYKGTDWKQLEGLIAEINPNISVTYTFGYYSSHSVCLPTFFPDPNTDRSWGYSLFILTINFLAFIFMLVAYIVLYRKAANANSMATASIRKSRSEQNVRMQRKLTRIVASDFLCWMPVCIMGFLQLGGVHIPNDAYLPTGLLIIPINSALNPLLYSDIPELILRKIRRIRVTYTRSSGRQSSNSGSVSRSTKVTEV